VEEGAAPLDTFIKLSGETSLTICSLPALLRRVAEGNGGGEQRAAGPLLAECGTPGDALHL
jgi:hypothetical protein